MRKFFESSESDPDQIILSSFLGQLRGVIGRYPDRGQEYVFEFDAIDDRGVHMIGVRRPLEVEWYRDGKLVCTRELSPWIGYHSEPADRVIERRPGGNHEY